MASSNTNKNGPGLFQLPPIALTTPNVFSSMSWFSCNTNNIFACCRWRAGDEISEKCVRVKATTACGAAPPEASCEYGEGDCNGPGDVGRHDGHAGCRGELVCGSNNCRKLGLFHHAKDDCCDLADNPPAVRARGGEAWVVMVPAGAGWWGTLQPPATRCSPSVHLMLCESTAPQDALCDVGEGDCDNDDVCEGEHTCGDNNCEDGDARMDSCVKVNNDFNFNHVLPMSLN